MALDVANLLAHLELRMLQRLRGCTEESCAVLGEALLEGLGHQGDPEFSAALRFYQATTFLRLASVYAVRPRWAMLFGPLVDRARLCRRDLERLVGEGGP